MSNRRATHAHGAGVRDAGGRTPIQHAAGLALQLPRSSAVAAQESLGGIFGELDSLLGFGTERQRDHAESVAADLARTMEGATQCRDFVASLLAVDEGGGEGLHTDHKGKPGKPGKPNGHQLFAELDGLLQTDAAVEKAAAPHLTPFQRDIEALMAKVANESSALAAKHVEESDADESYDRDSADVLGCEPEEPQEAATLEIAVDSTGPIFAELDSLLREAPEQHREQRDSLETSLARAVRSMAESQDEADAITEQLLSGDDVEDPSLSAWRRSALDSLRSEKRTAMPAASSAAMSPKASLAFHNTMPALRRSMTGERSAPALLRRPRTMSCAP